MQKDTISPGPWKWAADDPDFPENSGYELRDANGDLVLDDGSAHGEYSQKIVPDSANGRAVEALPDLLTACRLMLVGYRHNKAEDFQADLSDYMFAISESVKKMGIS